MKDKVYNAVKKYTEAYKNDDKELFLSIWDKDAIFEDPVGSEPCKGIDAISAFWDFAHPEGQSINPNDIKITVCANEAILQATMKAMHLCVHELDDNIDDILIDGSYFTPYKTKE